MAAVAFAAVALFFGVVRYSNAGATALAPEGAPGPNMVEVCSGKCTLISFHSDAPALQLQGGAPLFQLKAGSNWSQLATPKFPFDITCAKSCAEFGGDPKPGATKTLYAEKTFARYEIMFQKSADPFPLGMAIPAKDKEERPSCFMPTSKSFMPLPCGTSADSVAPCGGGGFFPIDTYPTESVIGGRIQMPDRAVAAGISVNATAVRKTNDVATGRWVTSSGVTNAPWAILLRQDRKAITGAVAQTIDGNYIPKPIEEGGVDGSKISFTISNADARPKSHVLFDGTIKGDEMKLKCSVEFEPGTFGAGFFSAKEKPSEFTARRDPKDFATVSVKTDSDGLYRFVNLPPGYYQINAGPRESLTYFPGVTAATKAVLVELGPNQKIIDRNFVLAADASPVKRP